VDLPADGKKDAELQKKHILKKVDAYNLDRLEQSLFTCNPKALLDAKRTRDEEVGSGDLFAELDTSRLIRQAYSKQNEPIDAKLVERKSEKVEEKSVVVEEEIGIEEQSRANLEAEHVAESQTSSAINENEKCDGEAFVAVNSIELNTHSDAGNSKELESVKGDEKDSLFDTSDEEAALVASVEPPVESPPSQCDFESTLSTQPIAAISSEESVLTTLSSSTSVENAAVSGCNVVGDLDVSQQTLVPSLEDEPLSLAQFNPLLDIPQSEEKKFPESRVIVEEAMQKPPIKNDFDNFFSSSTPSKTQTNADSKRATNSSNFSFEDDLLSEKKKGGASGNAMSALGDDFFGASAGTSSGDKAKNKRKTLVKQDFSSDEDDFFAKGSSGGKSAPPSRATTFDNDDDFFS
jgi:hypothetical protein